MAVHVLISLSSRGECRVAAVHDGVAEVRPTQPRRAPDVTGNIYRGRVVHVVPSLQSAFLDVGLSRNGFLHISDVEPSLYVSPQALGNPNAGPPGNVKPLIQDILKVGALLTVQVIKWPDPNKGPMLSTYLSLPSRSLVLLPSVRRPGVSRRIPDEDRPRLLALLRQLRRPRNLGFVLRAAGAAWTREELQSELTWLVRYWRLIQKRVASRTSPGRLYREHDPVVSAVCNGLLRPDVEAVWLDEERSYQRACRFARLTLPHGVGRLRLHQGPGGFFEKFGVPAE
jgi:ribonuclease E